MVFFSLFMWWAYSPNEYKVAGAQKTSIWRPLWDSINFCKLLITGLEYPLLMFYSAGDFVVEIYGSFHFFFDYIRGKPSAHSASSRVHKDGRANMNFGEAFGVGPAYGTKLQKGIAGGSTTELAIHPRPSYDEDVRLAPYAYSEGVPAHSRGKSKDSTVPPDQYVYAQ
jgi:hypothetical protein